LTGIPTSRHIDLQSLTLVPFQQGNKAQVWTVKDTGDPKQGNQGLLNVGTGKYLGRDESGSRAVASAPWLRSWETLKIFTPDSHGGILVEIAAPDNYNGVISEGSTLILKHATLTTEFSFYKA
jgi:hypothetical protein